MNNNRFAEDPDPRSDSSRIAVRDVLKTRGWFAGVSLDERPWPPEELRSAVEQAFCDFFGAWCRKCNVLEVDWDSIAAPLKAPYEPRPIVRDPRRDLGELFCRVAGIGESGRAFNQAAGEAGLSPEQRGASELRTLAEALRAVDREHLADRELPGKAGLLFERVARWPFVPGSPEADWRGLTFRCDLERYCDLTSLDLSEVGELATPACDKLLGHPQHLGTWLTVLGLGVASTRLGVILRKQPKHSLRDEILDEAEKLREALKSWLREMGHGLVDFARVGSDFQELAAEVFSALMERSIDVVEESLPANAWWRFQANSAATLRMWFARAAYEGRTECMPAEVATKWLRLVKQELSAFRPLFGQEEKLPEGLEGRVWSVLAVESPLLVAKTELERNWVHLRERRRVAELCHDLSLLMPSERFERDREHFLACVDQVFQLEGLWEGMRQLLLAMRALKSPCVASDLRYWEEPGIAAAHYPRQPEEPWRCIPAKLVASFHAFAAKEEARDPELKALRGQFAAFCLNGLRDNWNEKQRAEAEANGRKRTNEDMVEPSPDWRYCRVRAAKTLAINPDGRGHRLLQIASEIDPEPSVREVANDAYQSLRRGVTLPDGMSPRRAVLGAFWWLRQAHLKALGPDYEIDRDGAQRTRIKELNRTKERQPN